MSPELFIWILFHINPPSHSSNDEIFVARERPTRTFHFRKDLAASKYQDAVLKDGSVQEHLGVTWQFNMEKAPLWEVHLKEWYSQNVA